MTLTPALLAAALALLPRSHEIPDLHLPQDNPYFHNYALWRKSHLPRFLQVPHCTSMALLTRQVHDWASFDSDLPRLETAGDYETLLRRIYRKPTWIPPGTHERIVVPGYSDLNDLSREPGMVEAIQNVLGDALKDALRENWNWLPWDVYLTTRESRAELELRIRGDIARDRAEMIYLTHGTKVAHSVLLVGYEVLGDSRVRYEAYDSNHPDGPYFLDYLVDEARFEHPDFGKREFWVLHPYRDGPEN